MSRKFASATLIFTLMFITGFASHARTASADQLDPVAVVQTSAEASPPADVVCMSSADAQQVNGEGWLLCAGAVGGGILLGETLVGAAVGAALIACGCADYLDDWFDTDFVEACSYNT